MIRKSLMIICSFLFFIITMHIRAQEDEPLIVVDKLQVITEINVGNLARATLVENNAQHLSVSPDSTMLALATQHSDFDYDIKIFNTHTGKAISYMQGRMDFFRDLVWSPDNKKIAVISGRMTGGGVEEQSVKVYTIESGSNPNYYILGYSDVWYTNYVNQSTDTSINLVQVAWNPANNLIAIVFHDMFGVYDIDSDDELFSEIVVGIKAAKWSSDGKMIIIETSQNTVSVWGVLSPNG